MSAATHAPNAGRRSRTAVERRHGPSARGRTVRLALMLLAALSGARCTAGGSQYTEVGCDQTVLPSCASGPDFFSDEACISLDDALARNALRVDDTKAPQVLEPANGAEIPAGAGFTVRLAPRLMAQRTLVPPPVHRAMTFHDHLQRFFTLLPEAHAHCRPYTGLGYALVFRASGRTVLRVEQSTSEYTPGPVALAALREQSGPIELTVLTARFRESMVSEGPYAGSTPVRFTLR